jgi:DNA-binding MarR family transcriptional regulator
MSDIKEVRLANSLSLTEAIVLQQVHEDGEEDAKSLATMLGMSRQRTLNIIAHLRKQGLVAIKGEFDGVWVHLTGKGKRLMNYLWPESSSLAY